MRILHQIDQYKDTAPCVLTIGNFDGMHLGHQALFAQLFQKKLPTVVLTFSNHPLKILTQNPPLEITPLESKLTLFEKWGIDTTLLIPFTLPFSKQAPLEFLSSLLEYIPFSHLILGHDAVIGHAREGDAKLLLYLAERLNFSLEYVPAVSFDSLPISSRRIRHSIERGDLETVSQLLGRPFSILSKVIPGKSIGRVLGFKTVNFAVENLALPPQGVYVVQMDIKGSTYLGVANLGLAPTLHSNRSLLLEVHILDLEEDLYECTLEVVFLKYLRSEEKFGSMEALKSQIERDVLAARAFMPTSHCKTFVSRT